MKRPYEDDSYGSHGGQSGGYGGHDSRGDDNHYGKRMAYDSGRGMLHLPSTNLSKSLYIFLPPFFPNDASVSLVVTRTICY
jgi:hypothetical protein